MYASMLQTIEALKARPVFQKRDLTQAPMSEIATKMEAFSKDHGRNENIENATTLFYLSSHGFHCIEASLAPSEEMTGAREALALEHVSRLNLMALRMFYYLLTISVEEAAYGKAKNEGLFEFIQEETSPSAAKWVKGLLGGHRSGAWFSRVGDATLGDSIKAIEMCFRFAQWDPGFGGLPWAQIAETAGEVIRGHNSLELMVDKAFTLCHNNGAIFNKGHYFTMYKPSFYQLLDIQASGQMPGAIFSKVEVPGLSSTVARELHARYAKVFADEFQQPYDPSRVKSMEAVRRAKEAANAKKAHAFISGGGAPLAPQGPPRRACDDLLSLEQYQGLSKGGSFF